MKSCMQAMQFRHACKAFDPQKKIPSDDFQAILEFARLSPSSFGMEPARYRVIETPALREKLREACWNQPQITESSHVVVICALTEALRPGSPYVEKMFARRKLSPQAIQQYLEKYAAHHASEIEPCMSLYAWSSKQCYIALANMMTGAASLGIDSCPIEGFSKKAVEQALDIDTGREEAAVIVTFGYRKGEQTPRLRLGVEELVGFY